MMPISETRRCRRFIILALLLSSLMILYLMLDLRSELSLKKFILEENDVPEIQRIIQNYSSIGIQEKQPLLVLFTTMEMTTEKEHIYENMLRLWPQLKPAVLPVLLVKLVSDFSIEWQQKARNYGWDILPLKHTFGNLPIIRHMWLDVIEKYQGVFYAYANGDVLFDESLILTLQMLRDTNIIQKDPFIIGRRTNYHLNPKEDTLQNLKDIRTIMSKPSAELFIKDAEDYFITTRNGFPWKEIPDFVIGRVGWDNWLVTYALSHYHYVIDATNTITCLHQSSLDGNYAGFTHSYLLDLNRQLAGQGFKFNLGKTDCAKVEMTYLKNSWTSVARNGTRALSLRIRNPNPCQDLYRKKDIDVNTI